MAVVKAYKWMRFLSEADEIRKKKEKIKDNSPQDKQSYIESLQLRTLAFSELLKAGIPFIYIEDDDVIRINLDEVSYDIDTGSLKTVLSEEEYEEIINKQEFESGFNPDKDINVEEQKNDEFEVLRQKILSYGMNSENDDFKAERQNPAENAPLDDDFLKQNKFEEEYEEHYDDKDKIIDYRIDKNGVARQINTTEYGFMGVEHGIGTTHTAMMFARFLAKDTDKKVALVEINNSNNMKDLGEWTSGKNLETNNYPLGNIDVYFDVDYLTFTAMYKDNYDFVVIDFGCYNKKREVMKEFIRIPNKYILASGIDWNLPTLKDFYEDYVVDRFHSVIYMIPYLNEEQLAPIKQIVAPNKVISVPFNVNPFEVNGDVTRTFSDLLGIVPLQLEDKKSTKKGLFCRFAK